MEKKFRKFHVRALFALRKAVIRYRQSRLPDLRVIGVTGSNGKTTTVNLIHRILRRELTGACGSGKNRISAIADRFARVQHDADYFVQEVSAEYPGVLDDRLDLLRPNMAVITAIGLDHAKAFRNRESVAAEKGKLVEALPADGVAFLNADDPHAAAMAARTKARVVTFGLGADAEVRAVEVSGTWPDRLGFTVEARGARLRIETRLVGAHLVSSVLAAVAVALELGLSLETCAEALADAAPVYQRMSVHRHPTGAWMIADTFKAPFWSLENSLGFLKEARAPRRTVVLGDLSDILNNTSRTYRKAGRAALEAADRLVLWGEKAAHARKLAEGPDGDRVIVLHSLDDLIAWLDGNLAEGEVVLLKSNAKAHLERAFLVPVFGPFCGIYTCDQSTGCARCPVTRDIAGLHGKKMVSL